MMYYNAPTRVPLAKEEALARLRSGDYEGSDDFASLVIDAGLSEQEAAQFRNGGVPTVHLDGPFSAKTKADFDAAMAKASAEGHKSITITMSPENEEIWGQPEMIKALQGIKTVKSEEEFQAHLAKQREEPMPDDCFWHPCMQPDIVFYHDPCPDGSAAVIVISEAFPPGFESQFRPYVHGKTIITPNMIQNWMVVWFVDVTPPLNVLEELAASVNAIKIFDHHSNPTTKAVLEATKGMKNVEMELDCSETCCAALMLYKILNKDRPELKTKPDWKSGDENRPPRWLEAINMGDTSLLHKRTDEQKAYHAALTAIATPEDIDKQRKKPYEELLKEGRVLLSAIEQEATLCMLTYREHSLVIREHKYQVGYIDGTRPQVISAIYAQCRSSKKVDFIAIFWKRDANQSNVEVSLRSIKDGFDVSAVARAFGGNGHAAASGIQLKQSVDKLPDVL